MSQQPSADPPPNYGPGNYAWPFSIITVGRRIWYGLGLGSRGPSIFTEYRERRADQRAGTPPIAPVPVPVPGLPGVVSTPGREFIDLLNRRPTFVPGGSTGTDTTFRDLLNRTRQPTEFEKLLKKPLRTTPGGLLAPLARAAGLLGGVLYPSPTADSDLGYRAPPRPPPTGGLPGSDGPRGPRSRPNPRTRTRPRPPSGPRPPLDVLFGRDPTIPRGLPNRPQPTPTPTSTPRPTREPVSQPAPGPQPVARPQPAPSPRARPAPAASTAPAPSPGSSISPLAFLAPFLFPMPSTRPQLRPRPLSAPSPLPGPIASPDPIRNFNSPRPLTAPQPQPLSFAQPLTQPSRDPCRCDKPTRTRKKRKPRTVCYAGTYRDRASGLSKSKLRKIPCQ